MKLGIMQPYFLPYLGYWQLIHSTDKFVIYDNVQYTKKGWFNRNRFLRNGKDELFTIPLKKDNDYLNVVDRKISENFDRKNLIAQFQNAYAKAPYVKTVMPVLADIINFNNSNLFEYIYNSVITISNYLGIDTEIIISSNINCNHNLKGSNRVLEICKAMGANQYINAIGGMELYDREEFLQNGITLNFIKMNDIKYKQFENDFVPSLSIIDVMMFNPPEKIKEMLDEYALI